MENGHGNGHEVARNGWFTKILEGKIRCKWCKMEWFGDIPSLGNLHIIHRGGGIFGRELGLDMEMFGIFVSCFFLSFIFQAIAWNLRNLAIWHFKHMQSKQHTDVDDISAWFKTSSSPKNCLSWKNVVQHEVISWNKWLADSLYFSSCLYLNYIYVSGYLWVKSWNPFK